MQRPRGRSTLLLLLVVAFATVLGAVPVAADTPGSHEGRTAVHFLADSEETPGATCRYDGDQRLARIRVRDPFVFARDRSSGTDRQRVGWQVLVQELSDDFGAEWTTIKRSRIHHARASDATPADFDPITVVVDVDLGSAVRTKVRMFWYKPADPDVVAGVATHRVDWYHYPVADANEGFCPGAIL